jgi:creatinine amidohydrolase
MFEDLTWMDVEDYLKRDDRVVVTVGSCEQHAYLSLATDVLVPQAIAREACRSEGVLAAPALPFGVSPYFSAYPGTISLRPETVATVVREVIGSLLAHGFRRVLVNNGHGGNSGVLAPVLVEIGTQQSQAHLVIFHWWRDPAVVSYCQQVNFPQFHANWSESFSITRRRPLPAGAKEPAILPAAASAQAARAILGDGSFGGPYRAPQEISDRLFALGVEAMIRELRSL